jgi:RimJ/RimL family protein N-acetyltransferase
VLADWKGRGYRRCWLRVLEQNLRARRFYERRGWLPTGARERSGFAPFPLLLTYKVDLSDPPNRAYVPLARLVGDAAS